MIEMLHAAEAIRDLLHDPDLLGTELMAKGERQRARRGRDRGAARHADPPLPRRRATTRWCART